MQSLILKNEEVEFLGGTYRVTATVYLKSHEDLQVTFTDEMKAKILADMPTARFDEMRLPEPLQRGTHFAILHPLTGVEEFYSSDTVLDAFPDVDFDTVFLEYGSDATWLAGESISQEAFEAEMVRQGRRSAED